MKPGQPRQEMLEIARTVFLADRENFDTYRTSSSRGFQRSIAVASGQEAD